MAEPKTRETDADVGAYIDGIEDDTQRADARALAAMMGDVTGEPPRMWGASMVGFGRYRYRYASGREGGWFRVGFAPRKRDLTLYIMAGFGEYEALLGRLGKHKTGKSCLYIKRLSDVDPAALRALVEASVAWMAEKYPE